MAIQSNKIILIPKQYPSNDALNHTVNNYKNLRLTALSSNPEAFTSTYAREIEFSDETWRSRALNPLGRIFVALTGDSDLRIQSNGQREREIDGERLGKGPWLGLLTVLGPAILPNEKWAENAPWTVFKDINFEEAARVSASIPKGERVVYTLVGMYVRPEGRRAGNGQKLVEAALKAVEDEVTDIGVKATVVVLGRRNNYPARRMYERVGFVGKERTVVVEGDEVWALTLEIGH